MDRRARDSSISIEDLPGLPPPREALAALAAGPGGARLGIALLETVPGAPGGGRFSILAWAPRAALVADGRGARLLLPGGGEEPLGPDPLSALDRALGRANTPPAPWPFAGGAIGYLGYGLRRTIERVPDLARPSLGTPELWLGLHDGAIVWDHASGRAVAIGRGPRGAAFAERVARAARSATSLRSAWPDGEFVESPDPARLPTPRVLREIPEASGVTPGLTHGLTTSLPREKYLAAVRGALDRIAAGRVYQVCLTRQIRCPAPGQPTALYEALAARAPAPYGAFLQTGAGTLLGASPERFLSVRGDRVETRPIKGTRPRHADPDADCAAAEELSASAKERAELAMIVDLCRNDLGRVAVTGTVEVVEPRILESHAAVHQAVATIRARLRPDAGIAALLRATFPAGSVTGAPKIAAMGAIEELEPVAREVYTGAYGWLDASGDLDLAMTIRTALLRGGVAVIGAGGGIVADSVPEAEHEESLVKARALLEAIGSTSPLAVPGSRLAASQ
ncbi:MAG: anthranilate synthase component I family protein [Planctomycetales bacterium]|nr:anthranilate synthase component I family protein [Planctomycetales bacterium]